MFLCILIINDFFHLMKMLFIVLNKECELPAEMTIYDNLSVFLFLLSCSYDIIILHQVKAS